VPVTENSKSSKVFKIRGNADVTKDTSEFGSLTNFSINVHCRFRAEHARGQVGSYHQNGNAGNVDEYASGDIYPVLDEKGLCSSGFSARTGVQGH
jgi:hypothetical protein